MAADTPSTRIRQARLGDGGVEVVYEDGRRETVPQLVAGRFESLTALRQRDGRFEAVPR